MFSKLVMKLHQADNILYDDNLSFNHTYSNAECFTKSETYGGYLQWRSNWGGHKTQGLTAVLFKTLESSGT